MPPHPGDVLVMSRKRTSDTTARHGGPPRAWHTLLLVILALATAAVAFATTRAVYACPPGSPATPPTATPPTAATRSNGPHAHTITP